MRFVRREWTPRWRHAKARVPLKLDHFQAYFAEEGLVGSLFAHTHSMRPSTQFEDDQPNSIVQAGCK
jgi:hypothetical protein